MKRTVNILVCLLAFAASAFDSYSQPLAKEISILPRRPAPQIKYIDDAGKQSYLTVSNVNINVKIVGSLATTTMEITFSNKLPRILEGELNFPLGEGESVTRFAMDINGMVREGVVVEKDKGRKTFEEIVRRGVDPGLLEMTVGNSFKARVYPIPANGTKRIILSYERVLQEDEESMYYRLPLNFKDTLQEFTLKAEVLGGFVTPNLSKSDLQAPPFAEEDNFYVTMVNYSNFVADKQFEISLMPVGDGGYTITENIKGRQYFCINSIPSIPQQEREYPASLTLLWDASSSASKKDMTKEFALIKDYFNKIQTCHVDVYTFDIQLNGIRSFNITSGNSDDLIKYLKSIKYDGGTQLGAIDLGNFTNSEVLLFTDGISNFGKKELKPGSAPLYIISSAGDANHAYLRYAAGNSGGAYINLLQSSPEQALKLLTETVYSYISAEVIEGKVSSLYPNSHQIIKGNIIFTGVLESDEAVVKFNYGFGNEVSASQTYRLSKTKHTVTTGMLERIWALKKLDDLMLLSEKNETEITKLGKDFGIVTPYTSLIVLETVSDYVRYQIEPPADLKAEYTRLSKESASQLAKSNIDHLERVRSLFKGYEEWWNKNVTDEEILNYLENEKVMKKKSGRDDYSGGTTGDDALSPNSRRANAGVERRTSQSNDRPNVYRFASGAAGAAPTATAHAEEGVMSADKTLETADTRSPLSPITQPAKIELAGYKSDAPYIKALTDAEPSAFYVVYLDSKAVYGANPGFYIDICDIALEKSEKDPSMRFIALKIISNLAELELENRQLLRIMGTKLQQMKFTDYAVDTYFEVLRIGAEEPQTYRDLGLALAEAGRFQEACDTLYRVVTETWDGRFPEIELLVLKEMNRIIALHSDKVNTSNYDQALIKSLPVALRVVLNWSSDNTDIDLWLTEPTKEQCGFSHTRTVIGGRISRDFTNGYGPEEYELKKAYKGKYKVEANFFGSRTQAILGPPTLQMKLFTNYGTDKEEMKEITLRLKNVSERVMVGEFEF